MGTAGLHSAGSFWRCHLSLQEGSLKQTGGAGRAKKRVHIVTMVKMSSTVLQITMSIIWILCLNNFLF